MDFVRKVQSHPRYSPSSRHCLYGLDADLIMLGLVSHEKNFALLREEVTFGRNKNPSLRPTSALHLKFYLLYINLLREYLSMEFSGNEIDMEHLADDFVFFSVLLGNDFLPHIPHFHINENAYEILFESYKQTRLGGVMNDRGSITPHTFLDFIRALQNYEYDYFISQRVQEPESPTPVDAHTFFQFRLDLAASTALDAFLSNPKETCWTATKYISLHMRASIQKLCLHSELEFCLTEEHSVCVRKPRNWESSKISFKIADFVKRPQLIELSAEFNAWKQDYYTEKLGISDFPDEICMTKPIEKLILEYCNGLQWVMSYYYHGVSSWNWFYPYHYAPFISDVADYLMMCDENKSIFESDEPLGAPFRSLEQLLAVLPSASASLLPQALSTLMTDRLTSPIIDFYPLDFEIDLNGKKNDWEAIVKIPFIQEDRLLIAISERQSRLTALEIERNKIGDALLFKSNTANAKFEERGLIFRLKDLRALDLVCDHDYASLIPSLAFLPHSPLVVENSGICVFNYPSRNTSILVQIHDGDASLSDNPATIIGKTVLVNYPFVQKAVVAMYSDPLLFYDKFGVISTPISLEKFEFETFVQESVKRLWRSNGIILKSAPKLVYWAHLSKPSDAIVDSTGGLIPVLPPLLSIVAMEGQEKTRQGGKAPQTRDEFFLQLGLGGKRDEDKGVVEGNRLRKSNIMHLFSKIRLDA